MSHMKDPYKVIEKRPNGSVRVSVLNIDEKAETPSQVQQQFKDECDINHIMAKYDSTGQFTHLTSKQGKYADFSQITDYQDMLDTVRYADEAFNSLPASVRARFRNDPAELLKFVQDDQNYDEGVKLGLVQPKKLESTPHDEKTKPKQKNDERSSSKGKKLDEDQTRLDDL